MSSSSLICFNPDCIELKPDRPRKGWRLRSGDYAQLCDRCGFAFEEGRFCDTFHLTASGWRCCESCGKRVHCGCVASSHGYTLLDTGGIECIICANKKIVAPCSGWPSSLFLPPKDLSIKNWSYINGSSTPGPWSKPSNFLNGSTLQSEFHPRVNHDVDISSGLDRIIVSDSFPSSLEKKKKEDPHERFMNGSLHLGLSGLLENGNVGISYDEHPTSSSINPLESSFPNDDPSKPHFVLDVHSISPNGINNQNKGLGSCSQKLPLLPLARQSHINLYNGVEASNDKKVRNGKPRADARGRNSLLSRYWPKLTDQELQQISGDSNSIITPLFEKMLSASDAGRIGRLVLPKKCAEAYLPPISSPEGLPLKVQDSKGQEWTFQFRFWPNNNSRMYVLEGVTPCIQSMQLQAGDTVTFSRLEPEGKLIMGFRKASNASSDQGNQTFEIGNGAFTHREVNVADPVKTCPQIDNSGYLAQDAVEVKPYLSKKKKSSTLGSKSKRLRIEREETIELKITWEQAQGLFRPPSNCSSVVVIEGFEFEEYEDAPILGRPTFFATDYVGECLWVQCEDCFKWRRTPPHDLATLPSKWTCSENHWDPHRSLCSAAQELTCEQLTDMLNTSNPDGCEKMKTVKQETETFNGVGLDTLANIAILGEMESSQVTTKHPRHRPGCTCIVCIQPPSGKGPKHKLTCICNVCLTVKRRFHTLMLRREKKQAEKESESTSKQQEDGSPLRQQPVFEDDVDGDIVLCDVGSNSIECKSSASQFKGQFDLNIQPEREEDLSPCSDSNNAVHQHNTLMPNDFNIHSSKSETLMGSNGDADMDNAH